MQNKCKCKTDLKQKEILIGDLACEMPFEIPRGIWVPEMIWLAFCSPKSHGMSRENVKSELILIGIWPAKCLLIYQGELGFQK